MPPVARVTRSFVARITLLGVLLAACSDGTGTLVPEPGSYAPPGAAATGSLTGGSSGQLGAAPPNGGSGGVPSVSSGGAGSVMAEYGGSASGVAGRAGSVSSLGGASSFGTGGAPGAGSTGLGVGGASLGGASFAGAPASGGAKNQGSAGKSGTAGSTSGVTPTFAAVAAIVQANCGLSGCHGGARNPRLTNNSSLYKTLTSTTLKECGGNALVTAGDPTKSALLLLPNWECDDFVMPQGCIDSPCLADADLATISAWIQGGAKNP